MRKKQQKSVKNIFRFIDVNFFISGYHVKIDTHQLLL